MEPLFVSSHPNDFTDVPLLLKYRFPKSYRHATLDASLTKSRMSHEAKCLARCKRAGVDVPDVRGVDMQSGILLLEWIEGHGSIREVLGGFSDTDISDTEAEGDENDAGEQCLRDVQSRLGRLNLSEGALLLPGLRSDINGRRVCPHIDAIMSSIGSSIGAMHQCDVIHGDLTTSNMLLRYGISPFIVLIDFGLSYISTLIEDKAVDLYVLERALASTHPESEAKSKESRYIEKILSAYRSKVGQLEWDKISRRLTDGKSCRKTQWQSSADKTGANQSGSEAEKEVW